MSEIKITDSKVEMTVTYSESFSNELEMIEAVKGAAELRGLIAKPESDIVTEADLPED